MAENPLQLKAVEGTISPVPEWKRTKEMIFAHKGGASPFCEELLSLAKSVSRVAPVVFFTRPESVAQFRKSFEKTPEIRVEADPNVSTPWIRDYGPLWAQSIADGSLRLLHFQYPRFDTTDGKFLKGLSEKSGFVRVRSDYQFFGGDFFVDNSGTCFSTLPAPAPNPQVEAKKEALLQLGCRQIILLQPIPFSETQHIDMVMILLPNNRAIVAKFDPENVYANAAMDSNAKLIEASGYNVDRILQPNPELETRYSYSYMNSLIVGNHVFVPQYGFAEDKLAVKKFEQLGFISHPLPAGHIVKFGGSFHCVSNRICN